MIKGKWTKEKIAEWHKQALPDCTLAQQYSKANREAREYIYAKLHDDKAGMLEEMADIYIVNVVLRMRYNNDMARLICRWIEGFKSFDKIRQAVDDKMDVNAKRKFAWVKGEWRHVEDEEAA